MWPLSQRAYPLLYSTFIHMMKLMQEMHPDVEIRTVPGFLRSMAPHLA